MAKAGKRPASAPRAKAAPVLESLQGSDWGHAVLAALGLFVLFASTACRTIHTGDSPELATAITLFGVPHPPGYPLYTMVGGILVRLVPFARGAFAANLTSSLYGAAAAGGAWLLFRRLGASRTACWFGALVLGLGRTFWLESARAEVYTFDLLLFVAVLHATFTAARRATSVRLAVAGLLAGLWIGHRFVNIAYVIPLLVLVRPAPFRRPGGRPVAAVLGGFAASTLVYLYLPIASHANPALNLGDPETFRRFLAVVSALQYARHLHSNTPALAALRLGHYVTQLGVEACAGIVAAAAGALVLWRASRRVAAGWLLVVAMNLAIAARYNILDIDDYFLPSYLAFAALAAAAVTAALRALRRRSATLRTAATAATLAVALLGLPLNFAADDIRADDAARRLAAGILASAAPGGAIFTHGDTTVHSLWYLQNVEKEAPDVLVVSLGHSRTWYYEELRRRYPTAGIPAYAEDISQQAQAQRVIEALEGSRRICFTLTTDPSELAAEGTQSPWLRSHEFVPRGLVYEMRTKSQGFDPDAWTRWTTAFWDSAAASLGPIDPHSDYETLSIGVEFSLGLTKSAELLLRFGKRDEARRLFATVAKLDPDPGERELHAAYGRIGWSPPLLDLGQRARSALQALAAAPAGSSR